MGYEGGYDAVRRYARRWQRARDAQVAEAYVPLSFPPGEAYQFDWSHEVVVLAGATTIVKVAHVRLCYSRMLFVRAYPREAQEMVFDAHNRAFAFFKGAAKHGIYDNMKTAVDGIFVGKERAYNRRFLAMCSHYLVEPRACTPAAGWEKGQVENQVGVVRQRFFSPRLKFKSYAELNAYLLDRCVAHAQATTHPEQKDKTVFDVFEAERAALIAYRGPFDSFRATVASVSKTCLVSFDGNKYSVKAKAVGRPVDIHVYAERIVIRQDGEIVGEHARRFGRHQTAYDPWHYVPVLARKPGALRNGAPFKDWMLPASLEKVRRKLAGSPGWRPANGVDPHRRSNRWSSRCRSRVPGGSRVRHRQRRRHPEHPGAQPGSDAVGARPDTGEPAAQARAALRLRPLRQPQEPRF